MVEGYIPKEQRKTILLLTDDIRLPSGVGHIGKQIVLNSSHYYNWINLGGAMNHPDLGKRFDISQDGNNLHGITDASIIIQPNNGYGDPELVKRLIKEFKIDAIFLITDPRYFTWLFQIENEIRKTTPILYLNIWDDYPAPAYNKSYYESCDALFGISKQTVNINKLVLGDKTKNKIIRYVPHGLNNKIFKPLKQEDPQLIEFKKQLFGNKEYDFVLFFNSRNIRRKQIPDSLLAYKLFIDQLSEEQAKKCAYVLHTAVVDDNGTDLEAVRELILNDPKYNIIFSSMPLAPEQMNLLYNSSDAQILLTSNEGWGLALTEALLVGNPIIANVTGGMQDQMRFEFEDGKWVDFDADFPSNHRGTIKKHGEWAFPVYPTSRNLVGSPLTPYIWDDLCRAEDAAEQIMAVYSLSKEERKARGLKGMEWALGQEAGFTSEIQANRIIEAFTTLFNTWQPREKFELIDVNSYPDRVINHKIIY